MRRHEYLNFSPRHNFKVLWSYNSLCIYNTYTHIETLHFDLRRTSLANQFGMHLVYRRRSPHTHPQFAHFGSGCLLTLICSLDKHDADIYMTNTLYENLSLYLFLSISIAEPKSESARRWQTWTPNNKIIYTNHNNYNINNNHSEIICNCFALEPQRRRQRDQTFESHQLTVVIVYIACVDALNRLSTRRSAAAHSGLRAGSSFMESFHPRMRLRNRI